MEESTCFERVGEQISLATWITDLIGEVPMNQQLIGKLNTLSSKEDFKKIQVDEAVKGGQASQELRSHLAIADISQLSETLQLIANLIGPNPTEREPAYRLFMSFLGENLKDADKAEALKKEAVEEAQRWSKTAEEKDLVIMTLSKY